MPNFVNFADESNVWQSAVQINLPTTGFLQGGITGDVDWFKLTVPYGQVQISVLPDLARLVYPAEIAPFLGLPENVPILYQESTFLPGVYEHVVHNGVDQISFVSNLSAKRDDLAMANQTTDGRQIDFYDATINFTGPRTVAGDFHTGEYYLKVEGQAIPLFAGSGDPNGLDRFTPDAGRYLITTGNPTGQRTASWGGWIDTFDFLNDQPVGPGTTPPGDVVDPNAPPFPSLLGSNGLIYNSTQSIPGQHEVFQTPGYVLNPTTGTWSIPSLNVDLSYLGKERRL